MSGLKHRHHTVARVLLRGFARRDRVRMVRRDGLDLDVSVTDAAVGSGFYLFKRDGKQSDLVEEWFAEHVESPVGTVLPHLRQGTQPVETDVPALAAFVAASLLRTVAVRQLMDEVDAHTGPMFAAHEAWKQEGLEPEDLTAAEVSRWLRAAYKGWSAVERPQDEVQRSRLTTMVRQWDRLRLRLGGWTWSVAVSERPVLVTSDAPVATFRSDPSLLLPLVPPGLPVMLPFSPTSLLVAEEHPLGQAGALTPDLARLVNVTLARQAHSAVFCHPDMPLPEEVRLPPRPPALTPPRVTVERSESGTPPTFPARYPAADDRAAAALLEALGASDEVA